MTDIRLKNHRRLFPKFIMDDVNGRAMAEAIYTGLERMTEIIQDALEKTLDVEKMPEWRLDEMAWECNCLYDYAADIEQKRAWIRDAMPVYRLYGTPGAINRFLDAMFENVAVQENWEYGGEPYHFRVRVDGVHTPGKQKWIEYTVDTVKNVRSAFDATEYVAKSDTNIRYGYAVLADTKRDFEMSAAQAPQRNWLVDESGVNLIDETGLLLYIENGG